VFDLKNGHAYKKISVIIMLSLLVVLTLSIFLAQVYPVSAQTPAASLTGTITDRGVDVNGDGYYNLWGFMTNQLCTSISQIRPQ
jgi:hypothetical protein